jgi:ferritin
MKQSFEANEKDAVEVGNSITMISQAIEEENLAKTNLDKLALLGDDKANMYMFDKDMAEMAASFGAGEAE